MDTQHNDGGPAFPSGLDYNDTKPSGGMSLRDWFAGQYDVSEIKFPDLQSAARFLGEEMPYESDFASMVAFSCRLKAKLKYMGADAMLAARKEKQ